MVLMRIPVVHLLPTRILPVVDPSSLPFAPAALPVLPHLRSRNTSDLSSLMIALVLMLALALGPAGIPRVFAMYAVIQLCDIRQ